MFERLNKQGVRSSDGYALASNGGDGAALILIPIRAACGFTGGAGWKTVTE